MRAPLLWALALASARGDGQFVLLRAAKAAAAAGGDGAALAAIVLRYCRCRGEERRWSQPPRSRDSSGDLRDPSRYVRDAMRRAVGGPKLTVAILTYLPSAAARLRETVCHYARMGGVVDRVLVQWNDAKSKPPDLSRCAAVGAKSGVRVDVRAFAKNTLLNRYDAKGMGSNVLLQDDDVRYGDRAVRTFHVVSALFRGADKAPGGFLEDGARRRDRNTSRYLYNMATGTTSVLKRALIERFLVDVPPASRAYITDHKPTCEDMTLHFLASNATRQPPIWFELHSTDGGELDKAPGARRRRAASMHLRVAGWTDLRATCVDRVARDFRRFPRPDELPHGLQARGPRRR
ncbi:glucuronosyl-N-acetylglucosaminyl-proteoglycan 4-alpha-N-acetylglucosaminyltransferase [Aureococcus anophagefferens]|nr:glucuronosyl-N-acetylglucosaminyl-proteoglycan 4-alpha-N-acetylglucosaminyltransferase [Aureococcus anophagefferens]